MLFFFFTCILNNRAKFDFILFTNNELITVSNESDITSGEDGTILCSEKSAIEAKNAHIIFEPISLIADNCRSWLIDSSVCPEDLY